MKILFFSDAHGNQYSMRALIKCFPFMAPDFVVFGGDIFGYYYGQKEIIGMLRNIKCTCLLGNHDKYFLDLFEGKKELNYLVGKYGSTYYDCLKTISDGELEFLKSLDSRYDMEEDGLHLTFVHGSIDDALEGRIYPDSVINNIDQYNGIDYVFYGHTHHQHIRKLKNGTTLINPGSIGQQRDGLGCKYVIFDTNIKSLIIQKVYYDCDLLAKEIKSHNETSEMEQRLIEVLYRKKEE